MLIRTYRRKTFIYSKYVSVELLWAVQAFYKVADANPSPKKYSNKLL